MMEAAMIGAALLYVLDHTIGLDVLAGIGAAVLVVAALLVWRSR